MTAESLESRSPAVIDRRHNRRGLYARVQEPKQLLFEFERGHKARAYETPSIESSRPEAQNCSGDCDGTYIYIWNGMEEGCNCGSCEESREGGIQRDRHREPA